MPGLVWIIEALEGWGLTRIAAWLPSLFRVTPQKQEDKVHAIENDIAGKSDGSVDSELRSKWER
jgi:hypothetical protein